MAGVSYRSLNEPSYGSLLEELSQIRELFPKEYDTVLDFLIREGVESLLQVDVNTLLAYRGFIRQVFREKSRQEHYGALLEKVVLSFLSPFFEDLTEQIDQSASLSRPIANKTKMFLMVMGVRKICEIDYPVRKAYEDYLSKCQSTHRAEYVKTVDLLKLKAIEAENERRFFAKQPLTYKNDVIYLGYHPDYRMAMEFYYTRDKEELVFDFSLPACEKLKRQVFDMLVFSLQKDLNRKERRELYLLPLRKFYLYCVGEGIDDIETLNREQIDGFEKSMEGNVGTKTKIYMQIVNSARKFLFLSAKQTNWDANVWYMDRFEFRNGRANPAQHIECFKFYEIRGEENRALFKAFMKYQVGISHRSLSGIQKTYYAVKSFLSYCDEKEILALNAAAQEMDAYIRELDGKKIQEESFNKSVIAITAFYGYLKTKGMIQKMPFMPAYYKKKTTFRHLDRSVDEEIQLELLYNLKHFPEHLRLMCLIIWATGIRANEVCTLTGSAFTFDGEDAYLTLMQYKMGFEKKIPIPQVLYDLMKAYIAREEIGSGDFIFKSKKGRAYDVSTFRSQVQRLCRKYQVGGENYVFRPHDFRHQVGTELFDAGVSIQAIRDYHGHRDESMTRRYIDYMPKRMEKANERYFSGNAILVDGEGK